MTVNKQKLCKQCKVLTLLPNKFCQCCGNELDLDSTIPIEPGIILVNRYQICEQFSEYSPKIFLAQDLQSQDLVIIENYDRIAHISFLEIDLTLEDLELFKQQVLSWSDLQHPAIPKYLDVFYLDDWIDTGIFVVRPYINAPSLETVVRLGRKFSEAEVIELAERLLSILIYVHGRANPIIHRHITPDSILLVERPDDPIGDIYLINFRLSPTKNIQNWLRDYKGPLHRFPFYPPNFTDSASPRDDLSGLGVTLWYLLTGESPLDLAARSHDLIGTKLSNWIKRTDYLFLENRHLVFKSAELARIALNTEDVSISSRLTPISPDPAPIASTPLLDKDTSRSSNRPLYLQLIFIGTIVATGWILVAKNSVPTAERQQNQLPRSMSK